MYTNKHDSRPSTIHINSPTAAGNVYKSVNLKMSNFLSDNKSTIDNTPSGAPGVLSIGIRSSVNHILQRRAQKCHCPDPPKKEEEVKTQGGSVDLTSAPASLPKNTANCGEFCKHLSAEQQRIIIKNLIKREEETGKAKSLFMDEGNLNEKKYLVNAKWWK